MWKTIGETITEKKKKRWVTLDLRLTTYTNITVRSNHGLPGIYRRFLLVVERKYIYRRDWFVCFLLVLNTAATVRVISERSLWWWLNVSFTGGGTRSTRRKPLTYGRRDWPSENRIFGKLHVFKKHTPTYDQIQTYLVSSLMFIHLQGPSRL